jgi:hypothetical protein
MQRLTNFVATTVAGLALAGATQASEGLAAEPKPVSSFADRVSAVRMAADERRSENPNNPIQEVRNAEEAGPRTTTAWFSTWTSVNGGWYSTWTSVG